MKLIDNIKTVRLKKKKNNASKRTVRLKLPGKFETVLIVSEVNNEQVLRSAAAVFPNAEIKALSVRTKKHDESPQFRYTIHPVDFSLTGALKNDKLKRLFNTNFDLIVDLSEESVLLKHFLGGLKSELVVGKMGSPNEDLHDLLLEPGDNDESFLITIKTQLNLLANGHNKI